MKSTVGAGLTTLALAFCLCVGEVHCRDLDVDENRLNEIADALRRQWEARQEGPNFLQGLFTQVGRTVQNFQFDNAKKMVAQLSDFTSTDCGKASDPVHVLSLTIEPETVVVPGDVTISAQVKVARNITGPIKVVMKVEVEIAGIWVDVPCIDNFGSCTYEDVCKYLPKPDEECPPALQKAHIPCRCPFAANTYKLSDGKFQLPSIKIPVPLKNIDLRMTATAYHGGTEIGCLHLQIKVHV